MTSPDHLAAWGRSAGGLLVAATALQHPGLFRAALIEDGLVDLEFERQNSNAFSLSEFGNPADPQVRTAISHYSPVEIVRSDMKLPKILIVSRRNDQRVSAIGSRHLQARLLAIGADSRLINVLPAIMERLTR